jgi:hypothetical protein
MYLLLFFPSFFFIDDDSLIKIQLNRSLIHLFIHSLITNSLKTILMMINERTNKQNNTKPEKSNIII